MAVADHHIEWVEMPYRGKTLPAIFHLPPNYQAGTKIPVIVAVSGMDGFKERSVALKDDRWLKRGYAVLAFEGPGLLGAAGPRHLCRRAGLGGGGKMVADWLAKRPEVDATKIGMTASSFGSFFSAIMMSDDARFKACAITGTCYEPGGETIFNQASPTFKKRFMFMSGITDEHEFDEFRKTIDWNGYAQKIKGAYIVACGEYDQLCPLEHTEAFVKRSAARSSSSSTEAAITASPSPPPRRRAPIPATCRPNGWPRGSTASRSTNEYWTVDYDGAVTKAKLA